ncbi:hypothetical protein [Parapedobacter koreensis]|uniref:Uncharacterized protein n=1 Tax=Parapedobacter koreensis TaxID=332977 RepID=A0A1H7LD91_9SPHI|nr:hypothetical protein [Parapedobacter koreensis]SEK96848.1 hypothetical protein SAMN05421740_103126 [Parapedobacter koreensis]
MKGLGTLVAIQALLATISGVLISQMSLVGRVGISVLYNQYGVFKIWWKTALLLFAIQLVLVLALWLTKRLLGRKLAFVVLLLILVFGLSGAYFTYLDFTTTTHRLMQANFHAGGYLFWGTWGLTCLYFMVMPIKRQKPEANVFVAPPARDLINTISNDHPEG